MVKKDIFPVQIDELNNKVENDNFYLSFEKAEKGSENYRLLQEKMEGFIKISEFNYEKLRIFFSNYGINVIRNYAKYIDGNNIEISNHLDALNYYTNYQLKNGISYEKTIKYVLEKYGINFMNNEIFEKDLNRIMSNIRKDFVNNGEEIDNYKKDLIEMVRFDYIPENLDYETYNELKAINRAFIKDEIFKILDNGITLSFCRKLANLGIVDSEGIIEIHKLCKEIGEEEILFRLEKLNNMFENGVNGLVKSEIIKYRGCLELYSFLHDNPQTLKIGNKNIEFSHLKGPINVFRGILKLAENKCYNQFDEISLMYLIKEYEQSLNDFIQEGKNDYDKVITFIQEDRAFNGSQNIKKVFENNYGENYINGDEIYDDKEIFFKDLENYLKNYPTKKILLYIGGHGGDNGLTQTNFGNLYNEDIERLKKLSINYNVDINFDSCMTGEKIKGETGIISGSSLHESNIGNLVINDLLKAYKGNSNLEYSDIVNIKNIIGNRLYNSLKQKHFIGGIEKVEIIKNYYFNLNEEEKYAAKLIFEYLNNQKPKNGDFNGDGNVTWNEATLYKFLSAEYNIIPITYAKNIKNIGEKRTPITLS